MPNGFVSRAQQRYFFANPYLRSRFAEKEARKAGESSAHPDRSGLDPAYNALPEYKNGPTASGTAKRAR